MHSRVQSSSSIIGSSQRSIITEWKRYSKPRMKVSKSRSTGQALQRTEHMSNKVIQPDDATSVRAQLREILLSEIKEGRFPEGGRIPSERDLAQRYGISRASVREAITELINEGILFRTVGKGTYIATASVRAQASTQT